MGPDQTPPKEIRYHSASNELELVWPEGDAARLAGVRLRQACRCADCLSAEAVGWLPAPEGDATRIATVAAAGSYGIQIIFQDGHERGIYPWAYLRELSR